MKAYTDLEQSKKLAEILEHSTADNTWERVTIAGSNINVPEEQQYVHRDVPFTYFSGIGVPCWSLAALLEVIRNNGRYELQMYEGGYYFEANGFMTESYFNPVDACVEMILKLHEQKTFVVMDELEELKEKAKAYDEAKARMIEAYNSNRCTIGFMDEIFPELKESEDEDEKIKKELIDAIHGLWDNDALPMPLTVKRKDNWLAWIEKQTEQNPIDNVEPKFYEGDWIVYKNDICQIVKREEGCNKLVTVLGFEKELVNERNLSTARLWSIQDAKDGDVLKYKGCTFIFKKTEPSDIVTNIKNPLTVLGYCGINHIGFEKTNGWGDTANCKYHPATKEQRDTLMKAMTDAGYTFDFEKKELKKIEKHSNDRLDPRLKQKIEWKPSEKQMEALHELTLVGYISYIGQSHLLIELYNDLKKLIE